MSFASASAVSYTHLDVYKRQTQDSVKNALAYLHSLYEGGYINPEFITRDNNDALADVLNGQCGVLYAGHWVAHNLQTLNEQDHASEWI